ncbi:MAG TPA: CapA family protein [Thermomicrobiales bacterium]|nr:CapA family protein [Thermomicrobiales bacterium]
MSAGQMTLALSGDSLITRRIAVYEDEPTRRLLEILRAADVAFTNLETVPNNFQGYPAEESGGSHLGAHEWVLDELVSAGFNLFATPNNHSLNYEIPGLLALIDILDRRGLAYAGIGRNLAEARMPAYLDTAAGSVALVACASTFAKGQQASEQRPDSTGRPGLNPLRFKTTYYVTQQQRDTLREITAGLGLEQRRLDAIQLGFRFPPDDPDVLPFLDNNFKVGAPRIETEPNEKDLDANALWVREASMRSDLVVASLHSHEQGATKEDPADFIFTYARRMIDEGADVVVGHGPHLLRGMEIYKGKPIFYSLGNFVGQNELTFKLPADSYETFRIDPATPPGALYRERSQNDTKGFPTDRRYWQSIVPRCTWRDGALASIELFPVSLALGEANHRRGRPRLAVGDEATEILTRFGELSNVFGTSIRLDGEQASVVLG